MKNQTYLEHCLLDVLKAHKGTEYTTAELAHYLNCDECQVHTLMDQLRNNGCNVCTEPTRNVHYYANNKWWHFVVGGVVVASPLISIANNLS